MEILSFVHGVAGANMYVLLFGTHALVIDPCCPWEKTGLSSDISVEAVLCTHGHFDHISEADSIVSLFSCPLLISSQDMIMLPDPVLNHASTFGLHTSVKTPARVWEKEKMTEKDFNMAGVEEFSLNIISTPGHTSGSACFLFTTSNDQRKHMFTGDMLFRGSVGRTDLGGSEVQMRRSIEILNNMDDDILCYPGHGSATVLGTEKLYNPFFAN